MDIKGRIHSTESFGTVDGPGVRFVVFMQGCPMRCLYCHNPDTWNIGAGKEVSAEELFKEIEENKSFYKKGGITVSGGEPLLQAEFVTKLFTLSKEAGIHTALDTSGITFCDAPEYLEKLDKLLEVTNLVMLDIKHIDPTAHTQLTGKSNERVLDFAKYLEKKGTPVWIRHVIVDGYTTEPEALRSLGRFIGGLKNVKALDVLPYHSLGEAKYKELGIDYPLEGMPSLDERIAVKAKGYILEGIRDTRK